ncbi:MAG: RNA polymerase sigma factor [Candidatus Acidiferrales bacterium]
MNPLAAGGVFINGTAMDACAQSLSGSSAVSRSSALEREFEERLAECPALAFRVALGVLRNRADAEDVAQEAMFRAYRKFGRLRDRNYFQGWLAKTSFRLALDKIRSSGRRERRETFAATIAPPEASTEEIAAAREFEGKLAAAMDELPEKLRLVLILCAIEGNDAKEVGKLLGVPDGTVKSRLHLARKNLAERLRWRVNATNIG